MQELSYQSSLELQESTYNAIKHIPTAADMTRHARQHLVSRLDTYENENKPTFDAVIACLEEVFLPAIRRHALVGEARIVLEPPTIFECPVAMDMAIDVLFDRGYLVRAVDRKSSFHFKITFSPPQLHNVASAAPKAKHHRPALGKGDGGT